MKENQPLKANLQNHPSFQSKFKLQKPSIKVDYKIIHSSRGNEGSKKKQGRKIFVQKINNETSFRSSCNTAKQILNMNNSFSRVKSVSGAINQYESGKFVQSEYCTTDQSRMNQSRNTFHKGKVLDATSKYQHSKSVQKIIKQQYTKKRAPSCFVQKSRASRQSRDFLVNQGQKQRIGSSGMTLITQRSKASERSKLPSYMNEGIKDVIEYEHAGKYRQERVTPKCTINQDQKGIRDKFRAFNQVHDFDFRKKFKTLSNQALLTRGLR